MIFITKQDQISFSKIFRSDVFLFVSTTNIIYPLQRSCWRKQHGQPLEGHAHTLQIKETHASSRRRNERMLNEETSYNSYRWRMVALKKFVGDRVQKNWRSTNSRCHRGTASSYPKLSVYREDSMSAGGGGRG